MKTRISCLIQVTVEHDGTDEAEDAAIENKIAELRAISEYVSVENIDEMEEAS